MLLLSKMTTSISSEAQNLLWNRQTDKMNYGAGYLLSYQSKEREYTKT